MQAYDVILRARAFCALSGSALVRPGPTWWTWYPLNSCPGASQADIRMRKQLEMRARS